MLRPALLTVGLLGLLAGCSENEPPRPKDPWQSASSAALAQVLLPAYSHWTDSNLQLADSARAFCSGDQNLAQARSAYRNAHLAWASVQPLAIGPLAEGNLSWQVQFWPDKKNLVARQVKSLLEQQPALSREGLEQASVVVQGLTAYEYLLFDPGLNLEELEQKRRYCPLLLGIASHQQALATGVLQRWMSGETSLSAQLGQFPNARYTEPREAVADLLRTQVTALDTLKKKLALPLGRAGAGQPQPYLAEAWRSDLSLEVIGATLDSAQKLWKDKDGNGLHRLLPATSADLGLRLDGNWQETRQRLNALGQPLSLLLASESGRDSLNQLYDSLDRLERLQATELARALNVSLGFNANDGD